MVCRKVEKNEGSWINIKQFKPFPDVHAPLKVKKASEFWRIKKDNKSTTEEGGCMKQNGEFCVVECPECGHSVSSLCSPSASDNPIKAMPKVGQPQCMCENSKPGNVIPVTDGLKCTDCGRDFKYVKPFPGKSVPEELLKAAEILEKKAEEIDKKYAGMVVLPEVMNQIEVTKGILRTVAKALRGEE